MYNDALLNFINENSEYELEKDTDFIIIEAFYITDKKNPKDKRKLMIRSVSDGINHAGLRTAKLKSTSTDVMKGKTRKQGLPITFKQVENGNKETWEWDIGLKTKKEKQEAYNNLSKKDKEFLNNIIAKGGKDFAEYWDLNRENDNDRMAEIEDKYKK